MATRDQYLSQKHRLLSQAESGYSTTTSSEDGFDVCKTPKRRNNDAAADDDVIITKPMDTLDLQDALKFDPLDIRGRTDRKRASGSVYSDMSSFDLDDSLSNFESPGVLHHYQPETLQVPTLVTQPAKQEAFRKSRHLSTDSGCGSVAIGSDRSAFKPVKPRGRCYSSDAAAPSVAPRLLDFVETAGSELRKNFARSESCQAPPPQPRHQMTYTTDTMLNARVKHPHELKRAAAPLRHSPARHHSTPSEAPVAVTSSSSFAPPPPSPCDVTKLRCRIESSSGNDLKRLLRAGLESRNPAIVQTLNALIESKQEESTRRKEEEVPEMSHCVRCHKNFDRNQRSRCNIPHPESMVLVVGQDNEGTDFICKCCKKGFRLFKMDFYEESTNSLFTGHCYSGQHTTDPRHVRYLNRGGAAQTCSDNGCVEFYV